MQSIDQTQRVAVTAALSPASFTAANAEGARMRIPDALAYGLAATAAKQLSAPFPAWASRLKTGNLTAKLRLAADLGGAGLLPLPPLPTPGQSGAPGKLRRSGLAAEPG